MNTKIGKGFGKTVVLDKERVSVDHIGNLWISEWKFKKMREYRDASGEVTQEVPFEETLYLVSRQRVAIWFQPDEIRCLLNMIEGMQQLA